MPRRPERILLFRSGRHLRTAVEALRAHAPRCDITVVTTPSAEGVVERAGFDAAHRIIYDRTPLFQPWAFLTSVAGVGAITRRFDRVCVLWNDPKGTGQANVDQTALLVSPLGFTAITADGSLVVRRTGPLLARELTRALTSIGIAVALECALFLPARLGRLFRRWRPSRLSRLWQLSRRWRQSREEREDRV